MGNLTVPIVGAAVLVALAAVLWSTTREGEDAIDVEAEAMPAAPLVEDTTRPATTDIATPLIEHDEVRDAGVDSEVEPATVGDVGTAQASPFAATDADPAAAADSATATSAVEVSDTAAAIARDEAPADVGGMDEGGARGRIVVPNTYPIEDAAKYYLPPDQRGPGNLGGPPPLDFPGGPNDPNRESGGFAPPPAPGQ